MGLNATVWADDENENKLAGVRIGNIAHVGGLRKELADLPNDYPLLSERVLHSGSHCGDEIEADEVEALQAELQRLPAGSADLNQFRAELLGLCEVALKHGRAITF